MLFYVIVDQLIDVFIPVQPVKKQILFLDNYKQNDCVQAVQCLPISTTSKIAL